jgi:hypothetical protein
MFQLNQIARAIGLKAKISALGHEHSKSSEFRGHVSNTAKRARLSVLRSGPQLQTAIVVRPHHQSDLRLGGTIQSRQGLSGLQGYD